MDIEQLNKSQLVLLTLLVCFVTSLATSIVTVSLMEQAPPAITQTVNRIVERTVEKVVPQEGQVAAATNVVTEKTVVVHESDQVTEAVSKASPIAVRLTAPSRDANGYMVEVFLGLGVVASSDGLIFADATMMRDDADVTVTRNDGAKAKAKVVGRDTKAGIVRLQAATSTEIEVNGAKETKPLAWIPAVFVNSSPNLGETVIALAGRSSLRIATGIVKALSGDESRIVETSVNNEDFIVGSPLITTNGEVLGIATAGSRTTSGGFLASPIVLSYNKGEESSQ